MRTFSWDTKQESIPMVISFVEDALLSYKCDSKETKRVMILTEEILSYMKQNEILDGGVKFEVHKTIFGVSVVIFAHGKEIDLFRVISEFGAPLDSFEDDEIALSSIRTMLLKAYEEKLKVAYKNGVNKIRIIVGDPTKEAMRYTILACIFGVVFGFACKLFFPEWLSKGILDNVIDPVFSVFMSLLKMVMGPIVFFSIISAISSFTDLKSLGRLTAKVLGFYTLTSVISISIAAGIFFLIQPGIFGQSAGGSYTETVAESISLKQTILGIVPDNIFGAFVNNNVLQIVVLAAILGIATTQLGQRAAAVNNFFECGNSLFLRATALITRFLPIMIFCSVVSLIFSVDGERALSLLSFLGADLLAVVLMMGAYMLLILMISHLNPITFMKKCFGHFWTCFFIRSSSAAMPLTMDICGKKLGINKKIYSFSIPLGATINMDGFNITLMIATMFLAKIYGIPMSSSQVVLLMVTVILLSMATPGIPGSGIVCFAILNATFGIPMEAMVICTCVELLVDPIDTAMNVTGDMAASLIAASTENMVNKATYNK